MRVTSICMAVALAALCAACSPDRVPNNPNLLSVSIGLKRTACFGPCPVYRVEVRGNGQVTYHGEYAVLARGDFHWTIPEEDVEALVDEVRRADFYNLKSQYIASITDVSTYVVTVSIDGRLKSVTDYAGTACGGFFGGPCMPESVRALEDAIDRLSGALSVVEGSARTMAVLRQNRFDFVSQDAAMALLLVLDHRNAAVARELVELGAPLSGQDGSSLYPNDEIITAISMVPPTGDVELAKLMIAKGALKDEATRRTFLLNSAKAGVPGMVKLALDYVPDLPDPDYLWMEAAASAEGPERGRIRGEEVSQEKFALWVGSFNRAEIIRLLIAAGADPNAADEYGNTVLHAVQDEASANVLIAAGANLGAVNSDGRTPLHEAEQAGVVRALIKAGAKVNAIDKWGQNTLFWNHDADALRELLRAGANVKVRSKDGETPLFDASSAESVAVLIEAGVDMNALNNSGKSALQKSDRPEVRAALLRAGATLPVDPVALAELKEWAEDPFSEEVARALKERLAATPKQ